MKKIVLLRHGESVWNLENRFTGWTDVDLSEKGIIESIQAGKTLLDANIHFQKAYTSFLKRAIKTLNYVLDQIDETWIPVEKSWRLNEKHYGSLQGLNKSETANIYGEEQVHLWRRSFDIAPAPLDGNDLRNPKLDPRYSSVTDNYLPLTESLKEAIERVIPFWECNIFPSLNYADNILVVAHGNSLRGIIKHLKNISDKEITSLNLPTAIPYVFEFNDKYKLVKDYFLGDPDTIKKLMDAVAAQGKSITK